MQNFLPKNNVITLEHHPYSFALLPRDFYLFLLLKSTLNGRQFFDITDIIKNATEELKRFLQNGVQECFQHVYTRSQTCVVAQGDYF